MFKAPFLLTYTRIPSDYMGKLGLGLDLGVGIGIGSRQENFGQKCCSGINKYVNPGACFTCRTQFSLVLTNTKRFSFPGKAFLILHFSCLVAL